MNSSRSQTTLTEHDVRTHLDPAVMDGLLSEIVHSEIPTPARRSHRRAWALSAGAVLALGSTAAIAAGAMTSDQRETGVFSCSISSLPGGAAGGGVIGSVTGDPVVDCQAEYQRVSGKPAPPMVAYNNGFGGLEVLPASVTPPAKYEALPSGSKQDTELIVLDETLGDAVAGLNAACLDEAQATARSKQIVAALGYTTWSVVVDRGVTIRDAHCWFAAGRGRDKTVRVVLGGYSNSKEDVGLLALAKPLRESTAACWDRQTALTRIRAATASAGIPQDYVQVTTVDEAGARCSVIHLTEGGAYFAVVRGPAG